MSAFDRLELLKKYASEDPSDPFLLYALALETKKSDTHEASFVFRRLRQQHPAYLPQYYQAALIELEFSRIDECLRLLDEGIQVGVNQGDSKTVDELKALREQVLDSQ